MAVATGMAIFGMPEAVKAQETATGRRGVLLLDFSVGMAGSFEGAAKAAVLRELMPAALARLDPSLELAALGYGQRPRNSCGNIGFITEMAPVDTAALARGIGQLRAHRSRAPLADALAAAAAAAGPGPVDILAIVGGVDTCKKDVCTVATALSAARSDLTINVLGVGLDAESEQALRCIATASRGSLVVAPDRATLASLLEAGLSRLGQGQPLVPAKPEPTGPELQATAQLGGDGPELTTALAWTVERLAGDGSRSLVFQGEQPRLVQPVEAGRYRVTARLDRASASQDIDITGDGVTSVMLDLNAASLRLITSMPESTAPPLLVLSRVTADGQKDTVLMQPAKSATLVVPAGNYQLLMERGSERIERRLALAPGSEISEPLDLATGQLTLSVTTPVPRSVAYPVVVTLSVADPDAPGGTREVARSAALTPVFDVPAGVYRVDVRISNAVNSLEATVRAGEVERLQATVPAGILSIETALPQLPAALADQVWIEIWELTVAERRILRTSQTNIAPVLAAGRYRIEFGVGPGASRYRRVVAVAAGETLPLALKPELAVVKLRKPGSSDVQWEVRNAAGALIARAARAEPQLALEPGQYEAIARRGETLTKTTFSVSAGEQRNVTVVPE